MHRVGALAHGRQGGGAVEVGKELLSKASERMPKGSRGMVAAGIAFLDGAFFVDAGFEGFVLPRLQAAGLDEDSGARLRIP